MQLNDAGGRNPRRVRLKHKEQNIKSETLLHKIEAIRLSRVEFVDPEFFVKIWIVDLVI